MNLQDRIKADMKQAMRDRDAERLETIRMLRAAIQRREVDERITLDDAQILAVVQKLVKQGRDAAEQFRRGGRDDLAEKEERQITVYGAYLPRPLDEAELAGLVEACITESGAATVRDMGKVMALLRPRVQGRADMAAVSGMVKARLSGAG